MNLLLTFAPDKEEAERYYEWLKARTLGIIKTPQRWFQLERLAAALVGQDKLGARKVREILKEAAEEWIEKNGGNSAKG